MKRRFFMLAVLIWMLPVTCLATEIRGNIRLKMAYHGVTVPGGTVVLYDVSTCPKEMSPEELTDFMKNTSALGESRQIDGSGTANFENLRPGVYLLTQKVPADGYLTMKPFCVSLPITVNGKLIYEINAAPKLQPKDKLPQTGQLVWPAWAFIGMGLTFIGIGLSNLKRE